MKWPACIIAIRHDVSAYNQLKWMKEADDLYRQFVRKYDENPETDRCRALAIAVWQKYRLGVSDANAPLADAEATRATKTGLALSKIEDLPDVVFVSPYARTQATWRGLIAGWPELAGVKYYEEERIREQEHGLVNVYNDLRVFFALHPEQRALYQLEGRYWYRYPQGENVPDVRQRNRDWANTLVREFSGKRVLAVTHHLNILALRANYERLSAEEFIVLDEEQKPRNCGVTKYVGVPGEGSRGRLRLEYYNQNLYEAA
ncbi:MAG: histidine phosphatase family protein [Patescibacteria group bacterium]